MYRVQTPCASAIRLTVLPFAVLLALPAPALAQEAAQLVGRWGLASYFREADAAQVAQRARGACSHPYIIARGPNGGVMLNQPDQPAKSEHVIKSSWGGKTYIGPPGEAGGPKDREFVSASQNQFVLRWVDASVGNRYGVMIFVRCGAR